MNQLDFGVNQAGQALSKIQWHWFWARVSADFFVLRDFDIACVFA
jgi:hypothetical protein